MRNAPLTFTTLRTLLLSAVGLSLAACSGNVSCNDCEGATNSGGSQNGSGVGAGGTGGTEPSGCTNPKPSPFGGSGTFACDEGYTYRADAGSCRNQLPREGKVEWPYSAGGGAGGASNPDSPPPADECSSDQDCQPNASCELRHTNNYDCPWLGIQPPPIYERVCVEGCTQDADCGDQQVCVCGPDIGRCETISAVAGCRSDADCSDAALCIKNARPSPFNPLQFACELPGDECQSDADCENRDFCRINEDGRSCQGRPICGRPFLIQGSTRTATAEQSVHWLNSTADRLGEKTATTRQGSTLDATGRQTLAAHWTQIGLMEHASVAAFARFSLQLISLGAPGDLVEASARAQLDEAKHTRLAFSLASKYRKTPIGPGRLAYSGALDDESWEQILVTTILEGCIGETRAALEASHSAAVCRDPEVEKVLRTIAHDEGSHAELAWKAVAWMLVERPDLKKLAQDTFSQGCLVELDDRSRPMNLEDHGVLSSTALRACYDEATTRVILPCAEALLSPPTARTVETATHINV